MPAVVGHALVTPSNPEQAVPVAVHAVSVRTARLPATGTKVIVRSFLRPWLKALAWREAELKRDSHFRAEGERDVRQDPGGN
jgi:hypothetical protein